MPGQELALESNRLPGIADSTPVIAIADDLDQRLWLLLRDRLYVHDGGRVLEVTLGGTDVPWRELHGLAITPSGDVLVGTATGSWRIARGERAAQQMPGTATFAVIGLAADAAGDVWLRTPAGIRCRTADGLLPVELPAGARLQGLLTNGRDVVCWSRETLWSLQRTAGATTALELWRADAPIRAVAAADRGFVVCTEAGATRVAPDRSPEPLYRGGLLATCERAAASADGCWFAADGSLWRLAEDGILRPCALHDRGRRIVPSIRSIAVDRRGLVWLGTTDGVLRAPRACGIDNVCLAELGNDFVTAFAEQDDGQVFVGTAHGTLLALADDGAVRALEDLPWQRHALRTLAVDARGALFAGTRESGLWRCTGGQWQRVGPDELTGAVDLLPRPDGELLIACQDSVWSLAADGALSPIAASGIATTARAQPCTFHADGDAVWLGTFRSGLLRRTAGSHQFSEVSTDWQGESVLQLGMAAGTQWALTIDGLWSFDAATGSRMRHQATPRTRVYRSLQATSDALWLSRSDELVRFDAVAKRFVALTRREGAHPCGYSFRSSLLRRNGEVWIGARGGFTRVRPGTTLADATAPHVLSVHAQVGTTIDHTLPGNGFDLVVDPAEGAVRLHVQLLDRRHDVPPNCRLVLRSQDGERAATVGGGEAFSLPTGEYGVWAEADDSGDASWSLELGRLSVRPPASARSWWIAAAAAALVAAALWPFARRRWRRTGPARVQLADPPALPGRRSDDLLDLAVLAVAAAEECVRRHGLAHASVWLSVADPQLLWLGEIGDPCADARERAVRCFGQGTAVRQRYWADPRGAGDLAARLGVGNALSIEILLRGALRPDDRLYDILDRTFEPVLASLRKLAWLDRLEAELARRSAALASDLHDLRNPLTSLLLSSHELAATAATQERSHLRDAAEDMSSTVLHMRQALEQLVRRQRGSSGFSLAIADPVAIVEQRLRTLAPVAAAKSIRIVCDAAPGGVRVQLDEAWFGRAIDNLVGNAIKFSPTGREIAIHWERSDAAITLHIDDEGPGFAAAEVGRVFLPGVTGTAQPTAGESKSGMGLWIAREAIRGMGGHVAIGSHGKTGARVSCTLPVC